MIYKKEISKKGCQKIRDYAEYELSQFVFDHLQINLR